MTARRRGAWWVAALVAAGAAGAPPARAWFEQTEIGARAVAMGRAFTAVADDASAIYWNPAGLVAMEHPELHVTHHRPYLVPDLSLNFVGFARPMRPVNAHVAWSHLGASGVSEDLFYLGASRRVLERGSRALDVGGSLKLARVAPSGLVATGAGDAPQPDAESHLTGDLGVMARLSQRLTVGWVVRNVTKPTWDLVGGDGGTRLRTVTEGGLSYRWHPESLLSLGLVESNDGSLAPVAGSEILFYDVFALRVGVGDRQFFGGIGVITDHVVVDTAFSTHNTLGISTMLSLRFRLGDAS